MKFDFLITTTDGQRAQLGQKADHGQENDGVDDIEQGVGIGDMPGDERLVAKFTPQAGGLVRGLDDEVGVTGGYGGDDMQEIFEEDQHVADADDVEEEMGQRRAARCQVGADGGQVGGNRGADVFAEDQGHAGFERQDPGRCQGDGDADGRAAALDDHGQNGTDQDAEQVVVTDVHEQLAEFLAGLQRIEGLLHDAQAEEQHTEAEQDLADIAPLLVAGKELEAGTYADRRQSVLGDLEGDQLGGHGRADIRAQNDADRLHQRHQPGVDETDHHDRCRTRRLDDRRNRDPDQGADNPVIGQGREDFAHAAAGDLLQALRHDFHAEQEQTKAAQQTEDELLVQHYLQHWRLLEKELAVRRE